MIVLLLCATGNKKQQQQKKTFRSSLLTAVRFYFRLSKVVGARLETAKSVSGTSLAEVKCVWSFPVS